MTDLKYLVVGIYVDFMGTIGMEPADEMEYIETMFSEHTEDLNVELEFKREIVPNLLSNSNIDIYVFDFGGLLPGCDGLIDSMYGQLLDQVEDRPNTLFVLWGALSRPYYMEEMRYRFGEERAFPNVVFHFGKDDNVFEEIRQWIIAK